MLLLAIFSLSFMTYVIHNSLVPICIYRFRPMVTLRPCQPKLAKKQCKFARLMLVILAAPARSRASSESVSRHEKNPKPSIKPRMERFILGPPPPWGGGFQKTGEKLSQVLCERFQRATFHARKKILSTESALQVQRTRTDNF